MNRSLAPLALLCLLAACTEEETPTILQGAEGACGSVVEGVVPTQVACPDACPIPVKAFRVRDTGTCERSANTYVACVGVVGGGGVPGTAVLDTPDGPLFVESPSFDCTDAAAGCVTVDTATRGRWATCADTEEQGCECTCQGDDCPYDRFLADINGCGLPTPCEPFRRDESLTEDQLQCYMDVLALGGPIKIDLDTTARHHVTNQVVNSHTVFAISNSEVIRLDSVAFDRPVSRCELQNASFFLTCDPEDPIDVNVEDEEGLTKRVPCTDPEAWVTNCDGDDPVCPGS